MSATHGSDIQRVRHLRAQIRRYDASCGCELGTLFAVASLLAFAANVGLGHGRWSAWAIVWMIAWSLVGKLIGLGYARIKVVRLTAELSRTLSLHTAPREGIGTALET